MKGFIFTFVLLLASLCNADTIDGVKFEPVQVTRVVKDDNVKFILKSLVTNEGKKGQILLELICTGDFDYEPMRKRITETLEENESKELTTTITIYTESTHKYDNAIWKVERVYKIE